MINFKEIIANHFNFTIINVILRSKFWKWLWPGNFEKHKTKHFEHNLFFEKYLKPMSLSLIFETNLIVSIVWGCNIVMTYVDPSFLPTLWSWKKWRAFFLIRKASFKIYTFNKKLEIKWRYENRYISGHFLCVLLLLIYS